MTREIIDPENEEMMRGALENLLLSKEATTKGRIRSQILNSLASQPDKPITELMDDLGLTDSLPEDIQALREYVKNNPGILTEAALDQLRLDLAREIHPALFSWQGS